MIPPMLHTHSFIYHRRCIMFFSQYFNFPCQYHSTNAPHSFVHLPPTLYNVFLPVFQFSPVSIHNHSIFIHLPPTLCNVFLPVLQFPSFPCQYYSTNAPYSFYHRRCVKIKYHILCMTGCECPEGKYSIGLLGTSLGVWSTLPPSRSNPRIEAVLIIQEAGWVPGAVWTSTENRSPTGIRSSDGSAHSMSLISTELSQPHRHLCNLCN